MQSLKDQLSKIETSESSNNIVPETPQSRNINALEEESESETEQSQPESEDIKQFEINPISHREIVSRALDLRLMEKPNITS